MKYKHIDSNKIFLSADLSFYIYLSILFSLFMKKKL